MQLLLTKYRSGALAALFLTLTALPGHAQFGGVVFDPTQSAHALQQIYQNVQNSVTWQQQLANTIQLLATADKDYQQAITTYNMIHGNLKNFSSKSIWQTIQSQLTLSSFANQYGETSGLQAAMNGQAPGTSSLVWRLMNLGLNSTSSSFLRGQVLGSSHALATLSRMEAMDGVSSQCLGSVGNYNMMRNGNLLPQSSLTQSQFDTTSFTTTELEQLNLLNMANAHHLNESQAQGALHACEAAQAAVQNMAQRTAAADEINNAAFVQQQRSVFSSAPANSSHTWDTYLP
ncbi:hypothetical protein ACPOL_4708 [Acidisarcina polymorpha]|uniref:Uncharacterized protein n=1 Tax=Acidisarcina polymorpha TaxID=2211140 RepID=A0A2Z5G5Z6_9BACT|nr:hypothetical protein [Acidisarcina polymorpha]AXC13976.1 hypothetical protein ACPOL_4708 [Acidisarcina polymorpha]